MRYRTLVALLTSGLMILSAAACGGEEVGSNGGQENQNQNQPEENQNQPEENQNQNQPEENQNQPEENQPEENQPEDNQPEDNQPEDNQPEPGDAPECAPAFWEADACGGDPVGTWSFVDACTDYDPTEILALCQGAELRDLTVTVVSGSLVVTAENFARDAEVDVYIDLYIPGFCAAAVQGCEGVAGQIETASGLETTCVDDGTGQGPLPGNCDCIVDGTITESTSGSYTIDGGMVSVDGGNDYYFCVEDGGMLLRDADEEISFTEVFVQD